jgi:hypothetical protein
VREISCVAARCWSTDTAIDVVRAFTSCVAEAIAWTEPTVRRVEAWMASTWDTISSAARMVWPDRAFTSEATTAKPRPAAPARAASIDPPPLKWSALRYGF